MGTHVWRGASSGDLKPPHFLLLLTPASSEPLQIPPIWDGVAEAGSKSARA